MTSRTDAVLPVRSVAFVLTALLAGFMFFLACNGAFNTISAAQGFGVPLANPLDAFYLHVKADRDLAIGLAFLGLLIHRRALPLAWFTAACTVAPVIDCLLVASARGSMGYALGVHGSAAIYGIITTVLLRRHARASIRATQSA